MELRDDLKRLQTRIDGSAMLSSGEAQPEVSDFDLSFKVVTGGFGLRLIPVGMLEVMPGDELDITSEAVVRMSPMVLPLLSNVHARITCFYAPYRALVNAYNDDPRLWDRIWSTGGAVPFEWAVPPGTYDASFCGTGSNFDYFGYDSAGS